MFSVQPARDGKVNTAKKGAIGGLSDTLARRVSGVDARSCRSRRLIIPTKVASLTSYILLCPALGGVSRKGGRSARHLHAAATADA